MKSLVAGFQRILAVSTEIVICCFEFLLGFLQLANGGANVRMALVVHTFGLG